MLSNLHNLFNDIKFMKSGQAIADKATARVVGLENKIQEREQRIVKIRADYDISDADLIDALSRQHTHSNSYSTTQMTVNTESAGKVKVIPGPVIQNIQTEKELIVSEREQIKKLSILARNLNPAEDYKLTYSELELLDF